MNQCRKRSPRLSEICLVKEMGLFMRYLCENLYFSFHVFYTFFLPLPISSNEVFFLVLHFFYIKGFKKNNMYGTLTMEESDDFLFFFLFNNVIQKKNFDGKKTIIITKTVNNCWK